MIDTGTIDLGENASFEDSLQKIRELLTSLESGDLTLEESITTYQEGARLIEQCRTIIADAEVRITELTREDESDL